MNRHSTVTSAPGNDSTLVFPRQQADHNAGDDLLAPEEL
jgi:hypothetical protein